jgi:hypothetical protein
MLDNWANTIQAFMPNVNVRDIRIVQIKPLARLSTLRVARYSYC